jgi:hypothetical protein
MRLVEMLELPPRFCHNGNAMRLVEMRKLPPRFCHNGNAMRLVEMRKLPHIIAAIWWLFSRVTAAVW